MDRAAYPAEAKLAEADAKPGSGNEAEKCFNKNRCDLAEKQWTSEEDLGGQRHCLVRGKVVLHRLSQKRRVGPGAVWFGMASTFTGAIGM
jgi:hypothetical protein